MSRELQDVSNHLQLDRFSKAGIILQADINEITKATNHWAFFKWIHRPPVDIPYKEIHLTKGQ